MAANSSANTMSGMGTGYLYAPEGLRRAIEYAFQLGYVAGFEEGAAAHDEGGWA